MSENWLVVTEPKILGFNLILWYKRLEETEKCGGREKGRDRQNPYLLGREK